VKPRNANLPASCLAVSEILSRVGDKWSVLVVTFLGSGSMRFNELRNRIGGISQKMLTTTLRGLERDGFVTRTVLVPVKALAGWAVRNQPLVEKAREKFDAGQVRPSSARSAAKRAPVERAQIR
jgi:DNA-binding HxlR family transcriptional regulator